MPTFIGPRRMQQLKGKSVNSCLITEAVSGPCTRCGEYVTRMHLDDAAGMFCARCCPKHGNSGHLPPGPVKTVGEQMGLL